jgi:hypothetical protein
MIPNTYNPLDWNRYSYTDYNPVNRTDPTGHDPWWDDPSEQHKATTISSSIVSNTISDRSKGEVPVTTSLILDSDVRNANYGTKAEETYSDFGAPSLTPQYNPYQSPLSAFGHGINANASVYGMAEDNVNQDFTFPQYPVTVIFSWNKDSGGSSLTGVSVHNYSPTTIGIGEIKAEDSTIRFTIPGTQDVAGVNGSMSMATDIRLSNTYNTSITVKMVSVGGNNPFVTFVFSGGSTPPPGCAYVRFSTP